MVVGMPLNLNTSSSSNMTSSASSSRRMRIVTTSVAAPITSPSSGHAIGTPLSPNVRFSLPPSMGRVRVSQSVERQTRVPGALSSPLPPASTSSGWRRASSVTRGGVGVNGGVYHRRYSTSGSMTSSRRYDDGVDDILDYRSIQEIDRELDTVDRRRSAASLIRWARRHNDLGAVSPTSPSTDVPGSSWHRMASSGRIRSRSTSRRPVDFDVDYDDVISARRRARATSASPRTRAMSLPRIDASSRNTISGSGSRYMTSSSSSSTSFSSVTKSPGGIYWAGAGVGASSAGKTPTSWASPAGASSSAATWNKSGNSGGGGARHAAVVINDGWGGLDISSMVLQPGERFVPTDVSVSTLPSGQKAVTYTRFQQSGHGDQSTANSEIERVIQRTKRMQVCLVLDRVV